MIWIINKHFAVRTGEDREFVMNFQIDLLISK